MLADGHEGEGRGIDLLHLGWGGGGGLRIMRGMFATHICYSELLDILRLVLMEPPSDYCLSSDRFADQGMEVVPGEKSNSEWLVLND